MPRVTFVKKARKEYKTTTGETIPVGGSYYWWKFNFSKTIYRSLTPPKPAQLTQSGFLQSVYGIGDDIAAITKKDLEDEGDEVVQRIVSQIEDLESETEEKLGNMPDSLQEAPTGEILQNRIDSLGDWKSELEGVTIPEKPETTLPEKAPPDDAPEPEKQGYQTALATTQSYQLALDHAVQDLHDCMYQGE